MHPPTFTACVFAKFPRSWGSRFTWVTFLRSDSQELSREKYFASFWETSSTESLDRFSLCGKTKYSPSISFLLILQLSVLTSLFIKIFISSRKYLWKDIQNMLLPINIKLKYYVTMSVIVGNRHSGKRNVLLFSKCRDEDSCPQSISALRSKTRLMEPTRIVNGKL